MVTPHPKSAPEFHERTPLSHRSRSLSLPLTTFPPDEALPSVVRLSGADHRSGTLLPHSPHVMPPAMSLGHLVERPTQEIRSARTLPKASRLSQPLIRKSPCFTSTHRTCVSYAYKSQGKGRQALAVSTPSGGAPTPPARTHRSPGRPPHPLLREPSRAQAGWFVDASGREIGPNHSHTPALGRPTAVQMSVPLRNRSQASCGM